MKINKLKINAFGNLKNKEINLNHHINIIYGENEAGKSTLTKFIFGMLYGLSKNKKGKEISDFEKYKPWNQEEFSGKINYELDNKKRFEVYREFNKKNPKIYDENLNDISKEFPVDKNKGNRFFFEQTKIDEELFWETISNEQKEIELDKAKQNNLIQKITNLISTGDDSISYKKTIDKLNKKMMDEVGTARSTGRPINLVQEELEELKKQKKELENYKEKQYQKEEEEKELKEKIKKQKIKLEFIKKIKNKLEEEKLEKEKIKINKKIEEEYNLKINKIKNKLEDLDDKKINAKQKDNKKYYIFLILIILDVLLIILNKNLIISIVATLIIASSLIYFVLKDTKDKRNINFLKKQLKEEKNKIKEEIKLLEKDRNKKAEEIKIKENELNRKINQEKEFIKKEYQKEIPQQELNFILNKKYDEILILVNELEKEYNNSKVETYKKEVDYQAINEKLENLAQIEEQIENLEEQQQELIELANSINLAKQMLEIAYQNMKTNVTPKFTEDLSKLIAEITDQKYTNIKFNDEEGLVVENQNGDYINSSRLSIGTIDQMYLSLRISTIQEIATENMPLLLDEAFSYFDETRLRNILQAIHRDYQDKQIILFSCCRREQECFDKLGIPYHFIEI